MTYNPSCSSYLKSESAITSSTVGTFLSAGLCLPMSLALARLLPSTLNPSAMTFLLMLACFFEVPRRVCRLNRGFLACSTIWAFFFRCLVPAFRCIRREGGCIWVRRVETASRRARVEDGDEWVSEVGSQTVWSAGEDGDGGAGENSGDGGVEVGSPTSTRSSFRMDLSRNGEILTAVLTKLKRRPLRCWKWVQKTNVVK